MSNEDYIKELRLLYDSAKETGEFGLALDILERIKREEQESQGGG